MFTEGVRVLCMRGYGRKDDRKCRNCTLSQIEYSSVDHVGMRFRHAKLDGYRYAKKGIPGNETTAGASTYQYDLREVRKPV